MTMNVSLTPELEDFVNDKVKTGLYNSVSEVVRESLRLLRRQDELEKLQVHIKYILDKVALNSVNRGGASRQCIRNFIV